MAHQTRLYLVAGAVEAWVVTEQGAWQVFDAHGEQPATRYPVTLKRHARARDSAPNGVRIILHGPIF